MRITNEQAHMDQNLDEVHQTLTSLTHWMTIVEEITKNSNRMREDLESLNEDMAMV